MRILKPLILSVSLGCTVIPGPTIRAANVEDPLPVPSSALDIPQFEAEGTTLGDLVSEFARISGQHLVMNQPTRAALNQTPFVVGGAATIPPEEVYAFLESLLFFNGFVTARLKAGTRPLLGIYLIRESALAPRLPVDEDELGRFASHPAFLIQTVVQLEHLDVRQLSTSLRGIIRDTNTQTLLALGDHGVALQGTGQWVADITAVMRACNEQSRTSREHDAGAREAGEPGKKGR